MGEEIITSNEVYFSGRENIEGYASLVSAFLHQMRREAKNAAVINIDNEEAFNDNKIKRGQLLFLASI